MFGKVPESVDSLKVLLKQPEKDTSTVTLLIKIAKHYYHSDPDSTFKYAQKALVLSNLLDFSLGKGKAYRMIGLAYSGKSETDKALEYYMLALSEFKKANSIIDIGVIYTSIGIVYRKKSEYDKALEYYLKSLEIIKIENIPRKVSSALNNIGTIYSDLKDYDKALSYFNEALEINKEANYREGICYNYANIGVIYKIKKNYEPAIFNLKEALALFEEFNFKNEMAQVYSNLGEIYLLQNQYNLAFHQILTANRLYNEASSKSGIAETLILLSKIYLSQKKYTSAESAVFLALNIALETGYKEYELDAYYHISKIDSARGYFKDAFFYRNKYNLLKDSIFSIEKNKAISSIQEKFNLSEKEKENLILKKDLQINTVTIRKQKIINYVAGFSLVLLVVIIVLIVYSLKKIRKNNRLLHSKNEEIERQNDELETYKSTLENVVEERTKELNKALINAQESDRLKTQFLENLQHEIRTPMNAILGFGGIHKDNNLKENESFFYEIRRSTEDLLRTVDRLVLFSKFQIGDYDLVLKPIKLKDYFSGLYTSLLEKKQFLKKDDIEILFTIDYTKLPDRFISDEYVFTNILQELIDNAFKFTERGVITVSLVYETGKLSVIVSDTGVGIKDEISDQVFEFLRKFDQEKVIYRGMGVGLAMVRKGVELLSGTIQIKTGSNKGAELIICLPELEIPRTV
jgi:signal transduction histidine kinase